MGKRLQMQDITAEERQALERLAHSRTAPGQLRTLLPTPPRPVSPALPPPPAQRPPGSALLSGHPASREALPPSPGVDADTAPAIGPAVAGRCRACEQRGDER
ncbi:MAG: hypothetical protein ACLQUY_21495 [Ktedonobacterales bacterium]